MQITQTPSPNFGDRIGADCPTYIIIHYTAMDTARAAIARLCDPVAEVSAHYVIAEDGTTTQLVADDKRAWHAGVSQWAGECDLNSHSIGIELANPASLENYPPFPEPQMAALECLLARLQSAHNILRENILGHEHIAPGRKFDPGPKFDWIRIRGVDPARAMS